MSSVVGYVNQSEPVSEPCTRVYHAHIRKWNEIDETGNEKTSKSVMLLMVNKALCFWLCWSDEGLKLLLYRAAPECKMGMRIRQWRPGHDKYMTLFHKLNNQHMSKVFDIKHSRDRRDWIDAALIKKCLKHVQKFFDRQFAHVEIWKHLPNQSAANYFYHMKHYSGLC